jgi:glycosyltransferase involved in cell wall biosynthesis
VTRRLVQRGIAVEVLTADPSHSLPATEMLYGAPVRRARAWPRNEDYRFAPGVARRIQEGDWDVVHIQCYQTLVAPMAMAAAARAGIPYVLTFHGGGHSSRWRNQVRRPQLYVLRPLLARAAALIATADWEVESYAMMLRLPRSKFVVIPNGGDLPPVPEQPAERKGTLIVSIGRAERYKGHQRVIAALPRIIDEVPDVRLWIAGEGPYVDELAELATKLGVADRVEIKSVRNRAEYAQLLSGASVAAMLSEFETHPMGALEAITLGVPTLVADNSGLAELAAKGLAQPVPLRAGEAAHAAAIVRLIRDPPAAPDVVMPSWDACVDSLVALYGSVRAPGTARGRRDEQA